MARLQFKKKCRVCNEKWVLKEAKKFTICTDCHMRQIMAEDVTDKKYKFLNISEALYRESRFLRDIRQSYLRFHELSDKQIAAFKDTIKKIKQGIEV